MQIELINYYNRVRAQAPKISASTGIGLDRYLETVSDMHASYASYLKTHSWFTRIFLKLCWWQNSVQHTYQKSYLTLVDRVAFGYEDKMVSLLACKHLLENKLHRKFCADALSRAISNTYQNQSAKSFVWTVTNAHGVTSYLIGTTHQSTKYLAKSKGIQEALQCADQFFTEKGLGDKFFKCAYFPLMTKDMRFLFILVLEACDKAKNTYVLDNYSFTRDAQNSVTAKDQGVQLEFDQELPSADYFDKRAFELKPTDDLYKKIISEVGKVYLAQSVNNQQHGTHALNQSNNAALQIACDKRTNSWLNRSFKTMHSDTPLPGLLAQIQTAKKPICIAVGLAHCIGSNISLVEEFKKAGFIVERYLDA